MPSVPKPSAAKEAKAPRVRAPRVRKPRAKAAKQVAPKANGHAKTALPPFDGEVMPLEEASRRLGIKAGRIRILIKEGRLKAATNESIPHGLTPHSVATYHDTRGQRLTKAQA